MISLISILRRFKHFLFNDEYIKLRRYYKSFNKFSFVDCKCKSFEQFEASIIRLYHTIEKGLAFPEYRPGFGKDNIDKLIVSLEQYNKFGYDTNEFCYRTALSCLNEYVKRNKTYGFENPDLERRIKSLPGTSNDCGGVICISASNNTLEMNYEHLMLNRHSIRHFSPKPVDLMLLEEAIELAQFTPSACNRQGWKTRIIADKCRITEILKNQNGNRGFGQEFDKLLIITADLRAQQRSREVFEAFVDGGMYAESILNSLYFKGIGSVPLSASLLPVQEKNIRTLLGISSAEVFIMFIGVGNYPEGSFYTTRSERKNINLEIL